MIKITPDALEIGKEHYFSASGFHADGAALAQAYRAMRSLEPKPEPTPDMVHALCEALAKDGHDVDYALAKDAIRAMHGAKKKPAGHFGLSPRGIEPKAIAYRYPPDGIAPELDTYLVQQADLIDALTALTLELARRDPGYAPGDVKLNQLIAALAVASPSNANPEPLPGGPGTGFLST